MAEVHEDLVKLEEQLMSLRLQLRNLKTRAVLFCEDDHPAKYGRAMSANNQASKLLADQINLALKHLDQYEMYKKFYFNQEGCYETIMELIRR